MLQTTLAATGTDGVPAGKVRQAFQPTGTKPSGGSRGRRRMLLKPTGGHAVPLGNDSASMAEGTLVKAPKMMELKGLTL